MFFRTMLGLVMNRVKGSDQIEFRLSLHLRRILKHETDVCYAALRGPGVARGDSRLGGIATGKVTRRELRG